MTSDESNENTPEMAKAYDPREVEPRWYRFWEEHGVFEASDAPEDTRPVYVIPMPPPNVTGSLHMGHALGTTLQDVLVRYHRMRGHNTLWQPGIDHAGIATQTVVERMLQREGTSRHDLGREAFLERVWRWKAESGGRIAEQMRVLGASADWRRMKFTMDADMSRAVREEFVRLHREGLIYRATRLVHWDVEARTVLSNLEVENEETAGELFEFAYPVEEADGGGEVVVATTRPETMLGDTAIAVHPDDPRYTHLHGKRVRHPFVERTIPVITDPVLVDPAFGTGAVKVTPAHDFQDHATGKRHGLPEINILHPDGTLNENAGPFAGLDRFAARKAVKRALAERGLARGARPHQLVLPRSQRTDTVVEPRISTQWFVKMEPLAAPALAAVREGRTRLVPEVWVKTYEHWMTSILDWCISRQLWWGHRIPAWYCDRCGETTVDAAEALARCGACGAAEIRQDEDVLDTWFSSALWPFSTLGWPEETPALRRFYPASDLETGYDILFFWVARMMMAGLYLRGEVPFRRVLLHGLVVDETGDKMSKVKGNVIDPLDLVGGASFEEVVRKALPGAPLEEALGKFRRSYPSAAQLGQGFPAYGADALRMTLTSYSPQAMRIPLSLKKIEGYRNFCNKVWNATRFALPQIAGARRSEGPPAATSLAARWILARLASAIASVRAALEEFRLDEATAELYRFFWNDLCDWYLELSKPRLASPDEAAREEARDVLAHTLEASLRLLHPVIPFLSEELWQRLPRASGDPVALALAPYPDEGTGRADPDALRKMATLQAVVVAARTARSEHDVNPWAEVPLVLRADDAGVRDLLVAEGEAIRTLVRTAGEPVVEPRGGGRPRGFILSATAEVEVLVGLVGLVDGARERERVEREAKKVERDIAATEKKLALPSFVDRAPAEVVADTRRHLEELLRRRAALLEARGIADELAAAAGEGPGARPGS